MIAHAERYVPSRPWPRRALAAIGRVTRQGTTSTLLFASLAATVLLVALRRGVWHGPVWIEFKRVLHGVAVRSLATTIATGFLVGFALVSQAVYWLAATGQTGLVGPVIVVLLVREFVPILVGLIVFGRSGTATLIELGEAQTGGWLRLFEIQGLDPLVLLVLPRAFGFAIGAFCLGHCPAAVDAGFGLPRGARPGADRLLDLGFRRHGAARHEGRGFHHPAAQVRHHRLHGGARLLCHRARPAR